MVAAVIAFPGLVTGGIEKTVQIDADKVLQQMQTQSREGLPAPAASTPGGWTVRAAQPGSIERIAAWACTAGAMPVASTPAIPAFLMSKRRSMSDCLLGWGNKPLGS